MSETGFALELRDVTRSFTQGDVTLNILRGVDLAIRPGEIVALLGASGAGKSTLLQAAGLLESGFGGDIFIDGVSCARLNSAQRTTIRRDKLGFIYQFHHLLPDFTAVENVVMPQLIAGHPKTQAQARASELLRELGLGERLTHRPSQLSGGEQQRVAVARALANAPVLILADEPTGNLDEATARRVFDEFLAAVRGRGSAALVATHNRDLAARMDRCVLLKEGVIDGEATGAGVRLL